MAINRCLMSGLLCVSLATLTSAEDLSKLNVNIGGGINTPLNPTGKYVGVNGNFLVGGGYNLDSKNSIVGEFGWTGLPSNIVLHPVNAPFGTINLYTLTANYRRQVQRIGHSPFGLYAIVGGGWYYRHTSVDKNYVVGPTQPCLPIYTWWGYGCEDNIVTQTIASKGASAGGVNGGVGFTIRLGDSGWKFYTESRYNYAFTARVPTTFVPVTFGFRYR